MMGEEGAVIGGLLVGLNVIDCNLCIKGGDLDVEVQSIWLLYYYGLLSILLVHTHKNTCKHTIEPRGYHKSCTNEYDLSW